MRRAIALVLLAVAGTTLAGCAHRNGDLAAFCKAVPSTPAISTLSPVFLTGKTSDVVDQLNQTADQLRSLEHVAPRTIRSEVATTANFAERFAWELQHPSTDHFERRFVRPDNPADSQGLDAFAYDYARRSPVASAFAAVSRRYPGAIKAASKFASYSTAHCGADVVPKGYQGATTTDTGLPDRIFGDRTPPTAPAAPSSTTTTTLAPPATVPPPTPAQ